MAASAAKIEAITDLESAIAVALASGFSTGEVKKTVDAVEKVIRSRNQILAQQSDGDE